MAEPQPKPRGNSSIRLLRGVVNRNLKRLSKKPKAPQKQHIISEPFETELKDHVVLDSSNELGESGRQGYICASSAQHDLVFSIKFGSKSMKLESRKLR